ncbi:MAG: B12-binding domain-containing radical SAM protein, partial [candidate division Zixibacteria bacterium]|nr:B12-binding domain-containing radical SAM protein [candidate division Zixibacteria bacterium]
MKVLLIHPPSSEVYEKFKRKEINRLPIGLAYITAVAELDNHDVEVVDAEASHLSLVDIKSIAESYQPDVVGITCTTPIFPIAVKIADLLKDVNPFIKTIIGGPHINALPRESLLECSNIDYVVYGEGERTFSELLRCIEDGNR